MDRVDLDNGASRLELDNYEVSFLGDLIGMLRAFGYGDGVALANDLTRLRHLATHPEITILRDKVRMMEGTLDRLAAQPAPLEPGLSEIQAEIEALNERLNGFIPNFGAF